MFGLPFTAADLRLGAYLAVGAVACFKWRQDVSAGDSPTPIRSNGWLFFGAAWVVLAVVQYRGGIHELTNYWRGEAYGHGWYSERRTVQRLVIGAVAAAGAIGAISTLFFTPRRLRPYRLAVALTVLAVSFIVVRSVSLHSVDSVLGEQLMEGVRVGDAFEITAVVLVCVAVAFAPGLRSR